MSSTALAAHAGPHGLDPNLCCGTCEGTVGCTAASLGRKARRPMAATPVPIATRKLPGEETGRQDCEEKIGRAPHDPAHRQGCGVADRKSGDVEDRQGPETRDQRTSIRRHSLRIELLKIVTNVYEAAEYWYNDLPSSRNLAMRAGRKGGRGLWFRGRASLTRRHPRA